MRAGMDEYITCLIVLCLVWFGVLIHAQQLFASVLVPDAARYGPGPYPLIVDVYGGPGVQRVANSWATCGGRIRSQILRAKGFVVLSLDNRGRCELMV